MLHLPASLPPAVFRPRVFALAADPGVELLTAALARRRGLAVLDSAGGAPVRWSLVGFDPLPLSDGEGPRDLDDLRRAAARLARRGGDDVPGPFHGGFLGALSYDLGVAGERQSLPDDPWCSPPIVGGLYTDFVVCDHQRGLAWLVLGDEPGDGRPSVEARRDRVLAELEAPPALASARPLGPLVRRTAGAAHRERIERARRWIAEGEFYQANLAHSFTRDMAGHPLALYRRLRAVNPAPYMGYLAFGDETRGVPERAILSASPELFLELDERGARTRPIKGTIGRGATEAEDAAQRATLLASAKDRAELAMIVDLERNDLGRVAEVGSVRVGEFPALESYATLHHLVADVVGRPRPGVDAFDVVAALFPGGSITGAPKLRAMEAIAELEGEGRGFFTGSLGFVDARGHARFNILIRTLEWRRDAAARAAGCVRFHVGGGITWSSDAAAEDRETLLKGEALARALTPEGAPAPDRLARNV